MLEGELFYKGLCDYYLQGILVAFNISPFGWLSRVVEVLAGF